MNKNDILFVGIGQAGNNVVSEVLKTNKRYNGLFINTSSDDIRSIDNAKNVFIIPAAGGTARDRDKAKDYVKNNIYSVIDEINKFPNQEVVYFIFSTGGGTGSGITPLLINVLARTNPTLKINLVSILPSRDESKRAHENSLECWNEMVKLQNVNSYLLLDNNKRDNKITINKEFAKLFNDFMNATEANINGVIDKAEIEKITNAKGLGAIYDIKNVNNLETFMEAVSESIFATGGNINCKYIGLSIADGFDYKNILDMYNISEDYFVGYTDKSPIMMVSGIKMNSNAVSFIKDNLEFKNSIIEEDDEDLELSIDFKKDIKSNQKLKKEKIDIDDIANNEDDFWNDIMNM